MGHEPSIPEIKKTIGRSPSCPLSFSTAPSSRLLLAFPPPPPPTLSVPQVSLVGLWLRRRGAPSQERIDYRDRPCAWRELRLTGGAATLFSLSRLPAGAGLHSSILDGCGGHNQSAYASCKLTLF